MSSLISDNKFAEPTCIVVTHVVERADEGRLAGGEDLRQRELERRERVCRGARLVGNAPDASEPELAKGLVSRYSVSSAVDGTVWKSKPDLLVVGSGREGSDQDGLPTELSGALSIELKGAKEDGTHCRVELRVRVGHAGHQRRGGLVPRLASLGIC